MAASTESKYVMGEGTYPVPYSLFAKNRKRLVEKLQDPAANCPANAVVVLQGGKEVLHHDTDHEELFRQESYFHWTFGVNEPGCYGAVVVSTGESILFVPKLPDEYAVWMGKIYGTDFFKQKYEVDRVAYSCDVAETLAAINEAPVLLTMMGENSDSGNMSEVTEFDGIEKFTQNKETLFPVIQDLRVFKTPEETEVLRYVCKVSSQGHMEMMKKIKPGMMEYQLESVFLNYCYAEGGCRHVSYTCICASGHNGATLHYGHAGAPNNKLIKDGDMCLFDLGAEYHRYGSDITCSFPANGKFTDFQKIIYNAVLKSSRAVMSAVKPGIAWPDMHRLADRVHCEELVKCGLLKGDIEDLMSNFIGSLFMPHGLGHFLGIDTHDVGGYPKGVEKSTEPGLKSLRTGRRLEPGMCLTIEPGIYFIAALLIPALEDPVKSKFLNADMIKENMEFGGVRIEDDIIITKDGMELLSEVPRTVEEIEAFMAAQNPNCKK